MKYWKTQFEAFKSTKRFATSDTLVVYLADVLFFILMYVGFTFVSIKLMAQLDRFQLGMEMMTRPDLFVMSILSIVAGSIILIIVLTTIFQGFIYNYLKHKRHNLKYYLKLLVLVIIMWVIFILITAGLKSVIKMEAFAPFTMFLLFPIFSFFAVQLLHIYDTKIGSSLKNVWHMVKHFYYFIIPFILSGIFLLLLNMVLLALGLNLATTFQTIILLLINLILFTWIRYYIIGMCDLLIKRDKLKLYKY